MNILYITNSVESVINKAKEHAKINNMEFFLFGGSSDELNTIITIYNKYDNCVVYLSKITKAPVFDKLLKMLEENNKNIDMFACSSNYDVKPAVKARFRVENLFIKDSSAPEKFLDGRKITKEEYSNIDFYVGLANYAIKNKSNMRLLNTIIKNIVACTYNTPWDYYYSCLKVGWQSVTPTRIPSGHELEK